MSVLRIGAPTSSVSRFVVATPPFRTLYVVKGWNHERPNIAPWLEDIEGLVPPNAVSEIDVMVTLDAETHDPGHNTLLRVNASVALGPHDRAEDVWGNHVLTHENWDYLAGDRERIIARARSMAQGLGLDMSDEALYDAVQHKRASFNRVATAALAANRAFHAQLAGLAHEDHVLRRSDFGQSGTSMITVRVFAFPDLFVADEVRNQASYGKQRSMWACSPLPGVTRQAERVAILFAAPLPFRLCFLQRESPRLVQFTPTLMFFPWISLQTTVRDAIGWFDHRGHTAGLDARALFARWRSMPAYERTALLWRRANANEMRVRQQLRDARRRSGAGAAPLEPLSSPDSVSSPPLTDDEVVEETPLHRMDGRAPPAAAHPDEDADEGDEGGDEGDDEAPIWEVADDT